MLKNIRNDIPSREGIWIDDSKFHEIFMNELGKIGSIEDSFIIFPNEKLAIFMKSVSFKDKKQADAMRRVYYDSYATTPSSAAKYIVEFLRYRTGWTVLFYANQHVKGYLEHYAVNSIVGIVYKIGEADYGFMQYDSNEDYILRTKSNEVFNNITKIPRYIYLHCSACNDDNRSLYYSYRLICKTVDNIQDLKQLECGRYDRHLRKYLTDEEVVPPFW